MQSITPEQFSSPDSPPSSDTRRKRKRQEGDEQQLFFIVNKAPNKAPRRSSLEDEEEQLAREREIWGPEYEEDNGTAAFEYQHAPIVGADARAVGVHSAAALFRRPSPASKKYTSKFNFLPLFAVANLCDRTPNVKTLHILRDIT